MGFTVHEEKRLGLNIEICTDDYAESPREWDNLGTMVCWHNRYNLGDKHNFESPDRFREELAKEIDPTIDDRLDYWERDGFRLLKGTLEECLREANARQEKIIDKALDGPHGVIMLPLWLYDHSGISMSTGPFIGRAQHAEWDSGRVGFIYVTKDAVRKEFGWKKLTKARIRQIEKYLEGEVETYDQYLQGDVYEYAITDDEGNCLDSCGGFYGDEDYCLEEARRVADSIHQDRIMVI